MEYLVSIVWIKQENDSISINNQLYNKVSNYPTNVLGGAIEESADLINEGYRLTTFVVKNMDNGIIELTSQDT